ncbi:Tyrosine-protein kinase Wzc [Arcticibacter svalbardensis MN12-7]|uniref:non-specific protein-tyrosine kinase n=2 Tax=Arcticibacter TaxID=1288026 RepID=R9GTL5_9SPHI|nr:Tyrosine-protein kinase Wzc [Arcticibacter svalbardensis MN12-7]
MQNSTNLLGSNTVVHQKSKGFDIKHTLVEVFTHWRILSITLLLALAGAFLYLQVAKPAYEINATILIKDETRNPNQQSVLHELDLTQSLKIVENEIEIIRSKQLIGQVINDMQLWVVYQQKKGLWYKDIYKTNPVKFTLIKAGHYKVAPEVELSLKDKDSFYLKLPGGEKKEYAYNSAITSSWGTWKLALIRNSYPDESKDFRIKILDQGALALQYRKAIDVNLVNKLTSAVSLTIKDQIEQRGIDFLDHLIVVYNTASMNYKQREAQKALQFLDDRLALLSGQLTEAEKNLEGFKSSQAMPDISSVTKVDLENQQTNDNRLNEVDVQLSVINGIERYVKTPGNHGKLPATLGIVDPGLNSLIEKLSDLQLEHDKLSATTPETNPDFEIINKQIATTRGALRDNVSNIKSSLLNQRANLESRNARFESSIKNIPVQERQFVSIKRQQSTKENLYIYLLQKREEVSVNYASTLANDRVIDQAYSEGKTWPNVPFIIGIAIMLGLGLPAAFFVAKNILSNNILTTHEIYAATPIPILSELSFQKSKQLIGFNSESTFAINEQFKSLRTNLYYLQTNNKSGKVTLVTSSVPGEGKSFVSVNLSSALAFSGKKTIILEMDLRKPKFVDLFKLPSTHPGVTTYLNGNCSQEEIIQSSATLPHLSIITCGPVSQNPPELLESYRLEELMVYLKNNYEHIIIDSPPMRLVTDVLLLTRFVDVTLYVVRQSYTNKAELDYINTLNEQQRLPNVNIIFNGSSSTNYGYGYKKYGYS